MTMTRKDFQAIADEIKELPYRSTRDEVILAIQCACEGSNPRFDWTRFCDACQPDKQKVNDE